MARVGTFSSRLSGELGRDIDFLYKVGTPSVANSAPVGAPAPVPGAPIAAPPPTSGVPVVTPPPVTPPPVQVTQPPPPPPPPTQTTYNPGWDQNAQTITAQYTAAPYNQPVPASTGAGYLAALDPNTIYNPYR